MIRTGQVGESEQHPIAAVQQHIRSGRLGLHAPYREWRAGTWMTHWRDYFSKRAGALRRVTSARVVSGEHVALVGRRLSAAPPRTIND